MFEYDENVDILLLCRGSGRVERSEEHPWGLVDLDESGRQVGIEIWNASERARPLLLGAAAAEFRSGSVRCGRQMDSDPNVPRDGVPLGPLVVTPSPRIPRDSVSVHSATATFLEPIPAFRLRRAGRR